MELNFWELLAVAVALVLGVIAVKIAFTIDLNRFFEGKQKSKEKRLKALCPHTVLRPLESDKILVESCFNSPPGIFSWVCGQCGLVVSDESMPQRIAADWTSNPDGWIKADERFRKAYSKFYKV